MPRPKRRRVIFRPPLISGLKPFGSSSAVSNGVSLFYEEFEAIRLADYEGLPHQEAAVRMDISRPTFSRIYDVARQKLAKALIEGRALTIEGGHITFDRDWYKCNECSTSFSPSDMAAKVSCPVCRSKNVFDYKDSSDFTVYNLLPRPVIHDTGYCICPKCGLRLSHQAGIPCRSLTCSSCSTQMIREHHPIQVP